jgi:hypothetical protein
MESVTVKPENKNMTVSVGDTVVCTKPVTFVDGKSHKINDEFIVTDETLSYYRLFTTDTGNYRRKVN